MERAQWQKTEHEPSKTDEYFSIWDIEHIVNFPIRNVRKEERKKARGRTAKEWRIGAKCENITKAEDSGDSLPWQSSDRTPVHQQHVIVVCF